MNPQPSQPVELVGQQVYQAIRTAIVEMRLAPGRRLVERELIAMTDASRTSVREALRALIADGLVATIPYNQHVVAIPSKDEARELYEVRAVIESLCVKRFVAYASNDEMEALRGLFEDYRDAADTATRLQVKTRLYALLGSHAPSTYVLLDTLNARITLMRSLSLASPGRHAKSVEEIGRIVEAIMDRNVDLAVKETAEHVEVAFEVALEALNQIPWASTLNVEP